jgi:hypothetical protein
VGFDKLTHHWKLEKRRRRVGVVDDVGGHPNIGVAVVRQYRMAAVGVPGKAREIAAGDVDLEAVPGGRVDWQRTKRPRRDRGA